MSEKISIVRRLRLEANALGEFQAYASRDYGKMLLDAADEIERIRAERDEARWRLCKVLGDIRDVWGCEIAKENGWDYLATEAKP